MNIRWLRHSRVARFWWLPAVVVAAGCATQAQVGYSPDYVPADKPDFVAEAKVMIVMSDAERNFVYRGTADSHRGSDTTLTIPMGQIMEQITEDVFGSCFAQGVIFSDHYRTGDDYVVAVNPDISQFVYRYAEIRGGDFSDDDDVQIQPQVEVKMRVQAYYPNGDLIEDKTYASGIKSGESYYVRSKPEQEISRTLHATLHNLMLQAADDIRPHLVGRCEMTPAERAKLDQAG